MRTILDSRRLSLCGIRIDALQFTDIVSLVEDAIRYQQKVIFMHHNLHSLYLYKTNEDFRAAYRRASWVYVDGMPVIWLGKMVGLPMNTAHRVTFLDSFDALLRECVERSWRVFYLGSSQPALNEGLRLLREKYGCLQIQGHHGFLGTEPSRSEGVIARINAFRPDIVFVGMGMPAQEIWLAKHLEQLPAAAVFTSGGTLDYVSAESYRPPAWAGNLGLYGLFRLASEPKRLWRRYLLEPVALAPFLLPRLMRQRFTSANMAALGGPWPAEQEEVVTKTT